MIPVTPHRGESDAHLAVRVLARLALGLLLLLPAAVAISTAGGGGS